MDKDFLLSVFRETNYHLRVTERKYLIVTGAYIGFFTVILAAIAKEGFHNIGPSQSNYLVAFLVSLFILFVGLCIYMKQKWYRAWKEHYLDVCISIRRYFVKDIKTKDEYIFPYWLRKDIPESRVSVDNLLQYLTILINIILIITISYCASNLIKSQFLTNIFIITIFSLFIIFLYVVDRSTRKNNFLFA